MNQPTDEYAFGYKRPGELEWSKHVVRHDELDALSARDWKRGDDVVIGFTPLRVLTRATYVRRTDRGHEVKVHGSKQLVTFVLPGDTLDNLKNAAR